MAKIKAYNTAQGDNPNCQGKHFVTAIQWEMFTQHQQTSEMPLYMRTSSDKKLVKVSTTLNKLDYQAAISFK